MLRHGGALTTRLHHMHARARTCIIALALAPFAALLGGCKLMELQKENVEYSAATVLAGRISAGDWQGPVSVAAIRNHAVQQDVWLHEPGGFDLVVPDGEYTLVAFGDRDNDGRPDGDAPAGTYAGSVKVEGAGLILALNISLERGAAQQVRAALPSRYRRAPRVSTAPGALADLDAPQFSAESGKRGYWAPMEYFRTFGGNVYFIEPYDPARTPILFVHGATGSAQDFRYFIEHLDRTRYQAWIYQYPSGAPLEAMAHLLYWKLLNLQLRYGFTRLDVVAHSMGGLVARRFLLDHAAEFPQLDQFVSISSPWGGQRSAALGVLHSPAVIPSWRDLQPGGPYLDSLFARPLPSGINYTLLFGHISGEGLLREPSDGTILVSSQLRAEAQADASLVMGFDESHAGILSSAKVVSEVQRVFGSAAGATEPGGSLHLDVKLPEGGPEPSGISTLVLRRLDGDDPNGTDDFTLAVSGIRAGARLGPLPPGEYEVRLAAASFRARPDRQRLRIETGASAEINFDLQADGVMIGEVVAQSDRVNRPAGSYQRAENAIQADLIRLTGPGVSREVVPHAAARGALLEAYLDGRDAAANQLFCFMGLPAGEYTLTVQARGYEIHMSNYSVVPGRFAILPPVVMRKKPR
jgi:pimeloyl-ACP methyl ester carboxylesterase